MSKRRRSRKIAIVAASWSDLEQTFFDSAPPDEPAPAAAPPSFDDLISAAPSRPPKPAWLRRALVEARRILEGAAGRGLDRRAVWVVVASLFLLVGLSAGVFASRGSGQRAHRTETQTVEPRRSL